MRPFAEKAHECFAFRVGPSGPSEPNHKSTRRAHAHVILMDDDERQIVAKRRLWPRLRAWATAAEPGVALWRTVQRVFVEAEKCPSEA